MDWKQVRNMSFPQNNEDDTHRPSYSYLPLIYLDYPTKVQTDKQRKNNKIKHTY